MATRRLLETLRWHVTTTPQLICQSKEENHLRAMSPIPARQLNKSPGVLSLLRTVVALLRLLWYGSEEIVLASHFSRQAITPDKILGCIRCVQQLGRICVDTVSYRNPLTELLLCFQPH